MKRELGDRDAIEDALDPGDRAFLERVRVRLDVADWRRCSWAALFDVLAALELAGAVVDEYGIAPSTALYGAADVLGLPHETIRTRLKRWSEDSRAGMFQAEHGPVRRSAAKIVTDTTCEETDGNRGNDGRAGRRILPATGG